MTQSVGHIYLGKTNSVLAISKWETLRESIHVTIEKNYISVQSGQDVVRWCHGLYRTVLKFHTLLQIWNV